MSGKKQNIRENFIEKAIPYINNFFTICRPEIKPQKWDVESFDNNMPPAVFTKFINNFLNYSKDGDIDYTILLKQFNNFVDSELKCLKGQTTRTAQNEARGKEIQLHHSTGIYKIHLLVAILTKVLPQLKLSEKQNKIIRQDLLHEIFRHLPGCLEISIKAYTTLEAIVYHHNNILELLAIYETYLLEYVNTASDMPLMARTIGICSTLERSYEFYSILKFQENVAQIKSLFNQVHIKVVATLKTMKSSAAKQKLTTFVQQSKNSFDTVNEELNSPWISLFRIYHEEWIGNAQGNIVTSIETDGPELLSLLENGSLEAQTAFIERFSALLKHLNSLPQESISPEMIASYTEFMRLMFKKCIEKDFPQNHSMAFAIRGLIGSIADDIDASSPIIFKLKGCHKIIKGGQLNPEAIPSVEEFSQECDALKTDYEAYANTNPQYFNTTQHWDLAKRLERLCMDFKALSDKDLERSASALNRVLISILKLKGFNDSRYKQLALELIAILRNFSTLEHAANSTAPEATLEKPASSDDPAATAVSSQESNMQSEPDTEQDSFTPVLSAEQSPVISPSTTPPIEKEVTVDAEVALLSKQLEQIYLSQGEEQSQANQSQLSDYTKELQERRNAVQLAHDNRLKLQKEKNEHSLAESKKLLEAQFEKERREMQSKSDKEVNELDKQFFAQQKALTAKAEKERKNRHNQHVKALQQRQATHSVQMEAFRATVESSAELKEMEAKFQEHMSQLQTEFEKSKEAITKQIQAEQAKKYEALLQAQHTQNLAAIITFGKELELAGDTLYQTKSLEMQHQMRLAKAEVLDHAQARRKTADLVAVPLPLLNIMKQFRGHSTQPLSVGAYFSAINKIFISPDCLDNFNICYNLGLLSSIFPTLPERYGMLLEKQHPSLLKFWRAELNALNIPSTHSINILATFLLLPIVATERTGTITEHIQHCINDFIEHLKLDSKHERNDLSKALESILLGQEAAIVPGIPPIRTLGLYNKYCIFNQNENDSAQRNQFASNQPRGFHLQYRNEQFSKPTPTSSPKRASKPPSRTLTK